MFDPYRVEAEFALRAVRIAANLCRRIQADMVSAVMSKMDRSPVTVADFVSQAVVSRMLQDTFPGEALVAEEDSKALRVADEYHTLSAVMSYTSSIWPEASVESVCDWIDFGAGQPTIRFWVLDPIDGTKGFLRGDQYVVALALIEEGRVILGALGCPNLRQNMQPEVGGGGSAVIAVRNQGAWATGMEGGSFTKLHVSDRGDPRNARVLRSFAAEHTDVTKIDQLTTALGTHESPILMDSAAKYAVLSAGGGDLLFRLISPQIPDYEEKIWDQATGSILIEEAGGRVSDLTGQDLDFSRGRTMTGNIGVLASNGLLHGAALKALRATGADKRPEGL
jgi:3'(2'), 5'-bisphosphate nucleotidase